MLLNRLSLKKKKTGFLRFIGKTRLLLLAFSTASLSARAPRPLREGGAARGEPGQHQGQHQGQLPAQLPARPCLSTGTGTRGSGGSPLPEPLCPRPVRGAEGAPQAEAREQPPHLKREK